MNAVENARAHRDVTDRERDRVWRLMDNAHRVFTSLQGDYAVADHAYRQALKEYQAVSGDVLHQEG